MRKSIVILIIAFCSCSVPKNYIYFQDADTQTTELIAHAYDHTIQKDDLLYITVTCSNPDLSVPFNPPLLSRATNTTAVAVEYSSYLVNSDGEIVLPMLGKINVLGLTNKALSGKIEKLIIDGKYILDPSVTVKLVNYKIAVLGEVKQPGIKQVNSERITIFDALGLAGDLTIYGVREHVSIIREIDGKRQLSVVDLSKKEILQSPFYYLRPNDIIYIQPNRKQQKNSVWDQSFVSTIMSSTSVVLSALNLLIKL